MVDEEQEKVGLERGKEFRIGKGLGCHTITCCGTHAKVLEQNSYYRKAWADYRAARSITYSVKGGQDDDK